MRSISLVRYFIAVVAILGLSTAALAADASTQPAAGAAPGKVLIVPFRQIGDANQYHWIGDAIAEGLISDANHGLVAGVTRADKSLADAEPDAILKSARDGNASVVVFGSFQVVNDQLRATGTAEDVASGRVLASLKSTGAMNDLFKIEDVLSEQLAPVWANLTQQPLVEEQAPGAVPSGNYIPADNNVVPPLAQAQPQVTSSYTYAPSPYDPGLVASTYAPYDYSSYDPYAPYGYGYGAYTYSPYFAPDYYPYFYPGIFIGGYYNTGFRFGGRGFHYGPHPVGGPRPVTGIIGRLSNGAVLNNGGFGAVSPIVRPNFGFSTARFAGGANANFSVARSPSGFGQRFAAPRAFGGAAVGGGGRR